MIKRKLPLKRLHLFEFEDQSWLPSVLRNHLTEFLQYQVQHYRIYDAATQKLKSVMQRTGERKIVDFCSGGGGPLLQIQERLEKEEAFAVKILLTDKFPNRLAMRRLQSMPLSKIEYLATPLDINCAPEHLQGFRTFFTSFHHFKPEEAAHILRSAARQSAPIAIFEFTERSLSNVLGMLLSPIAVLFETPRLKPFSWSRLLLTYLLPLIPLLYCWDGAISHLRTYTRRELQLMVSQIEEPSYAWEIGELRSGLAGQPVTFLIGYPKVLDSIVE